MKKNYIIIPFLLLIVNVFNAQCLVADYPFNSNANDESGNGYNATVNGATLTTDRFGNPNSAYQFDGVNDFIDTETVFDFQNRSVSVWFYIDSIVSSNMQVLNADGSSMSYGAFGVKIQNGEMYANAGGSATVIDSSPNLGQWYHVVAVRNATQAKLYLDGVLVQTTTPTSNASTFDPNPDLLIGVLRTESQAFFAGKIDDVKVFDCELSQTEIDSLYNISGESSCLVADYPFNSNANDESGNGYNATVNGATLTTDRFGNPNSAYQFDGVNDFIDTETVFDFQNRSVSVWFYIDSIVSSNMQVLNADGSSMSYGAFGVKIQNGEMYANAGGSATVIDSSPNLGQWYHVVAVRNATQAKLYLDGVLVQTTTPTSNASTFDPNPDLLIGVLRTESQAFFAGKIDDVKVFDCELSQTEIDSLYDDYDIFSYTQEFSDINLSIYPNPMNDYAIIKFDRSPESPYTYVLFDQQGRIVKSASGISDNQIRIEKNNLANGVYFFQLRSKEAILGNYKLIIE